MTRPNLGTLLSNPTLATRASGLVTLGMATVIAVIELLIAPGLLVGLVTPSPRAEGAQDTTAEAPLFDPFALTARVNSLREEAKAQAARLGALRAERDELATRLRAVQPNADMFLLDKPILHSIGDALGGTYAAKGAVDGAPIDSGISRLLWNPDAAAASWGEIRDWDGGEPLFAAAEAEYERLPSLLSDQGGTGLQALVSDPEFETSVKQAEAALRSFSERVDGVGQGIEGIGAHLQTVEFTVDDRLVLPPRISLLHWVTPREVKLFLEQELALRKRHRYAMAQLPYYYALPRKTPWTWSLGSLHEAASSFDTWYVWATHPEWYEDSGLRLDPVKYPKDSERTRELHEEFRSVVYWQHCLDNFLWAHVDEGLRGPSICQERAIDPAFLERLCRTWAELERRYRAEPPPFPPRDPEPLLRRRELGEYSPDGYPEWRRLPPHFDTPEEDREWTALTAHLSSYFLTPREAVSSGGKPMPPARSTILPPRNR